MGTICSAIPGKTYNFTMTARSISGSGRFKLKVSCCDWGTKSQYSMLTDSESYVFSHIFGSNYETIYGSYTVPNNNNAWFLQGILEFIDSTEYDVSLFSVKRERNSNTTDNFHLNLSGNWYNVSGTLDENEFVNYSINPKDLCNENGVIDFKAFIDGNHYGMVNLIFKEPLLLCRNARFRINNYNDGIFDLSLTKKISQNSVAMMLLWNSKIFQKFPLLTEFKARFLMKGFSGLIVNMMLHKIILKNPINFKMFPFSTDSIYDQIHITADDCSGTKHVSNNGNIWLSCNCPIRNERNLRIKLE
jgi:hypothetical protein